MSLRIKMFLLPALAIAATAALVAFGAERYVRRQSQQAAEQRTQTLVAQFRRELAQRSQETARAVQSVADAEATLRMALDLARTQADPSIYANDARGLANLYRLDFLEFAGADGFIISSSHWPPASGYRNDWVANRSDWNGQGGFLSRVQLPDKVELGLLAVRTVRVGEIDLYVIGGWRFDRGFLQTLAVPEDMRALLYAGPEPGFVSRALTGAAGPVEEPNQFGPMIEALQRGQDPQPHVIESSAGGVAETFVSEPLRGRGDELLGALLVGSTQNVAPLVQTIRVLALGVAGFGILLGLALSWWVSARVSRPLAEMAAAVRGLQAGKSAGRAELPARGETAPLAAALNDFSGQFVRDRERLVQRERVSARREMARRFARELKESIFPLNMAAEDLVHAREETSERFDEIFFECATSMRVELGRLKGVAARFGEFGRAARPRPMPVGVNEAVRTALKTIEPQFHAAGRPPVTPEVHLGEPEPFIEADPDQLRSALENLLLHCLDAMPSGGTLAICTQEKDSVVRIEASAKGGTFSAEDCQRLFVPSGATPEGMTGLGLATVQAFVSDHGGRIYAESAVPSLAGREPGDAGITLRMEFTAVPAGKPRLAARLASAEQAQLPARAKSRAALPPAPASASTEAPVQPAAAPAEPVQATMVAIEEKSATEEVVTTVAASRESDPPKESPAFRGLTYR